METNIKNKETKLSVFANELLVKFQAPKEHAEIWMYFLVFIVVLGSSGLWVQYFFSSGLSSATENNSNLQLNFSISTYFIVLLSTSVADYISVKNSRVNKLFTYTGLGILITGAILFLASINIDIIFAFIGILLSWLVWFVANADNPNFTEKIAYAEDVSKSVQEHEKALGDL